MDPLQNAFWQQYQRFLKVTLLTETPHPDTPQLSQWAQSDLPKAVGVLKAIDLALLQQLPRYASEIDQLTAAVQDTLVKGHRVFIIGCGASGRLAMSLEWMWRKTYPHREAQVVAVMAGGDVALVRSIEQFEDHPEYGVKQLQQQGFGSHDLLIATTASGESPFIVEATRYAAQYSAIKPWLLVCNPREQLLARDANHPVSDADIHTFSVVVGPMALTGSTRMQATTALLWVIGVALLYPGQWRQQLMQLVTVWQSIHLSGLIPLIEREATQYQKRQPISYRVDANVALTVLTDVVERAPTFNIQPMVNSLESPPAFVPYTLAVQGAATALDAWQALLLRAPLCLQWSGYTATTVPHLLGFDFKQGSLVVDHFTIQQRTDAITLQLDTMEMGLPVQSTALLIAQIVLKLVLNIQSTLVMGRVGHYRGNLMTWLSPSNAKLIDRAIRTIQYYRQQQTGQCPEYRVVADQVLTAISSLGANESIVEKLLS